MYRKRKNLIFRVVFLTLLILIFLLLFRNCFNSMINDCDSSSLIKNKPTLIIDPGHGGFDGGAEGLYNIVEKDLNLAISLKLKEMLTAFGLDSVLVRDGDYSIEDDCTKSISERKTSDMKNRLKLSNNYDNPIFISIHQNKFEQSQCYGTQIFYGKNNPKSKFLAQKLKLNFKNDINQSNNREIKKADKNLFLLYYSKCPSVLIECGFISNPNEARLLTTDEYQAKISFVIVKSILDFIENYNQDNDINNDVIPTFFHINKRNDFLEVKHQN